MANRVVLCLKRIISGESKRCIEKALIKNEGGDLQYLYSNIWQGWKDF